MDAAVEHDTAVTLWSAQIDTPLGPMRLAASARGLGLAEFCDRQRRVATGIDQLRALIGDRVSDEGNAHTALAARELTAYFAGTLRDFSVPLDYPGSHFQRRAWSALLDIPFGQTRRYGEQAAALGDPRAARATGAANGQNRLAIIIPCHRVIGASGKLTGYGGGLDRKRWLLEHEVRVGVAGFALG